MNADEYVLGGEKTEKVLKRMEREGYIVKVTERDGGGEESVDYVVGPRGKAEVGEIGVAGMVRKVYGRRDVEAEELDRKLVRSLGEVVLARKKQGRGEGGERENGDGEGEGEEGVGGGGGRNGDEEVGRDGLERDSTRRGSARTRRTRNEVHEEEEDEDEE